MKLFTRAAMAVIVYTFAMLPMVAHAAPPAVATFGTSWDGPSHELQNIVDAYIGIPGAVNVHTDYIGAHDGDIDPWFWVGQNVPALLITEVAGNANVNELGWYLETGAIPALDGTGDGVVFAGSQGAGANTVILLPDPMSKFGFYLNTHIVVETTTGTHEQVFYTNRRFNDAGPLGSGAIRAPWDGDIQALIFDVSRFKNQPNTYLVCFEDIDSGNPITPCCSGTDDDYNDFVFQVSALGATPTTTMTFGALKARYR